MEAVLANKDFPSASPFNEVMKTFFKGHSPDTAKNFFWKMFQCWAIKDCKIKAELSDEEVALFFDQLSDLLSAAYILYQANIVSQSNEERDKHE